MLIFGIETSCDDTAASVVKAENGQVEVLSNILSSQIELHSRWGGVVPNLAAREHLKNILPVIEESLDVAKISPQELDLLAVTEGPGLIPALLIGANTAKSLAYAWRKPLIGVHHVEGHIFANFIHLNSKLKAKSEKRNSEKNLVKFPILCLVVSGGHTQLILARNYFDYEIIGETLDDAAGEAFDKVARILGLSYPGGPIVAQKARLRVANKKLETKFPRPMINSKNFDFSFSGLKTAVLYETKKHPDWLRDNDYINEVCYEFQQSVIDVLILKTLSAAKKFNPQTVALAGGVSANEELRKQLEVALGKELPGVSYLTPSGSYSTDNAAMIAVAGYFRYEKTAAKPELDENWKNLQPKADLRLKGLTRLPVSRAHGGCQ